MDPDFGRRTARVLAAHGLSLPEYQVMTTAGYRVTLAPAEFVSHASQAWEGDPRGSSSLLELNAALQRLQARRLMECLTAAHLRAVAERRRISTVPEVVDSGFRAGHVDFTHRGYALYRQVVRAIHGDAFLLRADAGFNLDPVVRRFDVYAPSVEMCAIVMDEIQGDGDSYTGTDATTFVERYGPTEIGAWKPNRFFLCTTGYHGMLRYVSGPLESRESHE